MEILYFFTPLQLFKIILQITHVIKYSALLEINPNISKYKYSWNDKDI